MKKNYKEIIIFLVFSILTFIYSNFIFQLNCDEIWNYGFAHNILTGLIPYRDFNMILTPLYSFSLVPVLYILGDRLLSLHIYASIILSLTILFMYKKIGKKAFIIYPIMILGYLPSYNLFSVFLFSIFILLNDTKIKYKDIVLGLIVSLMFLTKQTIGAFMFIPLFIYSKNKLKTTISFIIPILIFILYLVINDALYNFIDYCFLGLFSFAEDNGSFTISSVVIILLSIFMIYKLIKSKFKKTNYFYALMFQVMCIPMGDHYHFFTSLSVIIFAILIDLKLNKTIYRYILSFVYITVFLIKLLFVLDDNVEFNVYKNKDVFYARNMRKDLYDYLTNYELSLEKANELGYDKLYVLSGNAYYFKLYKNQTINKFDLINNGNMGYKSYQGFIDEIEETCKDKECVFIVEKYEKEDELGQTNKQIMDYPKENAMLKSGIGQFEIYKNEKLSVK